MNDIANAISRLSRWYTGDVHDVMDHHGVYGYLEGISLFGVLKPGEIICGEATTVRYAPSNRHVPQDAYHGAIDTIAKGNILVVDSSCAEGSGTGELMSTGAKTAGAAATIVNGTVRDLHEVGKLGYPLFARGASPVGVGGRMEPREAGIPITIGKVVIHPGDIVLADINGVVVIPRALASTIADDADKNGEGEQRARDRILAGEKLQSIWPMD
ncbi:hypothetical protein RDV64_09845 [Acuticoccus sp. MNP-M23]|uniref:RraA family protein n=1 Tax=Acuticoccus sp. MNP-M23 TaxID=3072793 RepID=UPI0028152DA6|nr:hypothetical protein [Acuticoccus sp. MNP-M23]WMS44656.1 hypothetical protein RDV64_09845 [Acuticoccus sp. MNP-M23]